MINNGIYDPCHFEEVIGIKAEMKGDLNPIRDFYPKLIRELEQRTNRLHQRLNGVNKGRMDVGGEERKGVFENNLFFAQKNLQSRLASNNRKFRNRKTMRRAILLQ